MLNKLHKFGPNKTCFEWFPLYGEKVKFGGQGKKNTKWLCVFSSHLYKSENFTLPVYKSKPNVRVLLLSTKHTDVQVEDNYKRVPETITL